MSPDLRFFAVVLLFISLITAVSSIEDDELQSMLTVLRARGYTLFSNAIITSDLLYDVLSGTSFTFFAPTDSSIFALDMTTTASDYVAALRCHVVDRRLSLAEIRRFPSGSAFRTLAKRRAVHVRRRHSTAESDVITVDGVDLVLPGLFYSRHVAVHGLAGMLNCRPHIDPSQDSPPEPPIPFKNSTGTQGSRYRRNHRSRSEPPPVNDAGSRSPSPVEEHRLRTPPPVGGSPSNRSFILPLGSPSPGPSPTAMKSLPHDQSVGSPLGNPSSAPSSPSPDFPANQSFGSPGNQASLAPSAPANTPYLLESPNISTDGDFAIPSPAPQTLVSDGPSSPEIVTLTPDFSPAYNLWPGMTAPPSTSFAPRSTELEPPVPEFSENDDPLDFPPSTAVVSGDYEGDDPSTIDSQVRLQDYDKQGSEIPGKAPARSRVLLDDVGLVQLPSNLDCSVSDGSENCSPLQSSVSRRRHFFAPSEISCSDRLAL